jgi:hypothetical protein
MGEVKARRFVPLAAALCLAAGQAFGQSITTEAAMTAGDSTDSVLAAATQLRAFGEGPFRVRYYVETAWARTGSESDAFGAAYPYGGRLQAIESYGEWFANPSRALLVVRAGRFRTPFGISTSSDHAYNGFLRAPLIRYDGYYALSNSFLEHGVDVLAGVPRLTVEASVGRPADVGEALRPGGLDRVVRVQSTLGQAIVGVSHIRTKPYQNPRWALGDAVFTGVDVRWMAGGVQLRGEWIGGRPFDGTTTTGWYADAIVHRRSMGPVTAVARIEKLDYDTTPNHALHSTRQTIGARIRVREGLAAQVNLLHHTGLLYQPRRTSLDVGVTYSIRH